MSLTGKEALMSVLDTSSAEVRQMVAELQNDIGTALGPSLLGLYLTGSLTYGDFDVGSSDIDYLVVLQHPLTSNQRAALIDLHAALGRSHPDWRERIEGSYVTPDMLPSIDPPAIPRPYVNQGKFWEPDPPYGNEWLINRYVLQECGVPLIGPAFRDLTPPIGIEPVRVASARDLFEEWLPQVDDPDFLPDSHHEAYTTLTMCRIMHRQFNDEVVSKRGAALWVRSRVEPRWQSLIDAALAWQHGQELDLRADVCAFVSYTSDVVQHPPPIWTASQAIGIGGPTASPFPPR
jgi:hypothetical protein